MKEIFSEIFTNIDFQSLEQKKEEFGVQMKEIENEYEQSWFKYIKKIKLKLDYFKNKNSFLHYQTI